MIEITPKYELTGTYEDFVFPSSQVIADLGPNVVGHNLLETMVSDLQTKMIVDSPNVIHGCQFVEEELIFDPIKAQSFLSESAFVNPRYDNFYGDLGLVSEPDYSIIPRVAQFPENPMDAFENIFEINPIIIPFDDFAVERICYLIIDNIHKLVYSKSPHLTVLKLSVIAYLILETFSLFSPRYGGNRDLPIITNF